MSEAGRIRFNRTLFSIPMNGHAPVKMLAHLAAEDIELILDIRHASDAEQQFDRICEEAEIYYIHNPDLRESPGGEDLETGHNRPGVTSWAAGLSLRHRTCIIGDDDERRVTLSRTIARSAGQRMIDLETSPAPIALPDADD